jgi:hypothetical protein
MASTFLTSLWSPIMRRNVLLAGTLTLACWCLPAPAVAQSEPLSAASGASLNALGAVSVHASGLLGAGVELTVASLQVVGSVTHVILVASVEGVQISLEIGSEVVRAAGLVAGGVVVVSATTAGWLLHAGAHVIAFVPDALGASMIHSRQLQP